mmetsp:Transcript_5375/g.12209  ORF Transcript_5375/g.12209 Transcript_5375/m.12209 type:complete len:208 (-) Transcript_5375:184-807(-)|eukprot:CAMPEP_0172309762 /NCGR_PEP_ID=MMETSP1058-20130122/10597_1 /TAXON_ID=83371 /ORGANISM="Detonula confervacea, Strain CCMP 353" /LENGTH=207 /DNA_ID=CAMNT_0013022443 /DNA_START=68 /DNA_END=691 /DNA_ORIENTATION=+
MSSDEEDIDSIEEEEEIIEKPVKRKRKKKKKDPNRPKRNMSAFFLYSNANRARVKEESPEAKFGDIAKLLSVEFKAINTKERAKYDQLAVEDKERYQAQMETYEPPSESDSDSDSDAPKKKKKIKKKKDPNAPKRNQSSFFLYSNATRNDVKTANPEAKFGEIAQIISRHFKALPDEERAYWNEKAAQDKVRYLRAKAEYEGTEYQG